MRCPPRVLVRICRPFSTFATKAIRPCSPPPARSTPGTCPSIRARPQSSSSRTRTTSLGGFLTNCCVESTMRSGYEKGYQVVTLSDCLAATSEEEHDNAIRFDFPMFSQPMRSEEFAGSLAGSGRALVDQDRDAVADGLGALEREHVLVGRLAPEALAGAEDHRVEHQPQLVHQARLEQAPHQRAAAVHDDVAVDLVLHARDGGREVVTGDHR